MSKQNRIITLNFNWISVSPSQHIFIENNSLKWKLQTMTNLFSNRLQSQSTSTICFCVALETTFFIFYRIAVPFHFCLKFHSFTRKKEFSRGTVWLVTKHCCHTGCFGWHCFNEYANLKRAWIVRAWYEKTSQSTSWVEIL